MKRLLPLLLIVLAISPCTHVPVIIPDGDSPVVIDPHPLPPV